MNDRFASDELVYDGAIVQVHDIGLRTPSGGVVRRDYIHYPGAAVILPVLADGSVLLIRNYRFAVDEYLYELPAGTLDEGEDPAHCARRELTEETGYTAREIRKLGQFYTVPGTADELMHAYLATDLTEGRQALERHEQITVERISESRVREMIRDGRVHDGKTIATFALYWLARRP